MRALPQSRAESAGQDLDGSRPIAIGAGPRDYWRELWRSRDLVALLSWRDITVRYKQTVLGIAWSVLRPLLVTAILAFVFGMIGRFGSGGPPYLLLVLVGIAPWYLFANAFQDVSNVLVANAPLVAKVYFPRLVLPISALGVHLLDFAISLGLLAALAAWYGIHPTWRLLFLPIFAALAVVVAFGPGLLLATLHVRFRDFRFIVPLVTQIGLYLSPVGYDASLVPAPFRFYYSLNPMVGVIEGFRWSILGIPPDWNTVMLAVPIALGLLLLGVVTFRRSERPLVDWL